MRLKARTDTNHREIVEALRGVGASVVSLASVAHGCPDLLVGFRQQNFLLEVKDGERRPSQRRLTEDEQAFHSLWRGQVAVVESKDEALRIVCS